VSLNIEFDKVMISSGSTGKAKLSPDYYLNRGGDKVIELAARKKVVRVIANKAL
jgi:hypothetical protein